VTVAPNIILSLGIGSCVVITLYDTRRKIGGLAHVMLPDSNSLTGQRPAYHCADTAIATLLKELISRGAKHQNMVAKIIGGAQMFACSSNSGPSIGKQNVRRIRQILDRERIPLKGEDTGNRHGRNIEFYLDSGKVMIENVMRKKSMEL